MRILKSAWYVEHRLLMPTLCREKEDILWLGLSVDVWVNIELRHARQPLEIQYQTCESHGQRD